MATRPEGATGRAKVHCGQDVATRPERFHLLLDPGVGRPGSGRSFDPAHFQTEGAVLLVGNEQAHRGNLCRVEWRHAGQDAAAEGRHEVLERQPVFLPFAALRLEGALVKRRVESRFRARGEFVAVSIPAQPDDEAPAARQVVARRRRPHRSKPAVVFQRHHAAEDRAAVGENLETAGGHAAHHVVVDDLPGRRVGRSLKIKESSFGSGLGVHGDGEARQPQGGDAAE